jgi:hypothetical protein
LDRAYVNFCHWGITQGEPDNLEFTERGFFVNWLRHKAYLLKRVNFPQIDLVIPMAVLPDQRRDDQSLRPSDMSFIIISVKNKGSGDGLLMADVPWERIDGDRKPRTEKHEEYLPARRRKRKASEPTTTSETKRKEDTPITNKHNFRLDLNSLPFVKSVKDNSIQDPFPETNKEKPYIAFLMSLGDTDRQKDLFVGEDWKAKPSDATPHAPKQRADPAIVTFLLFKFFASLFAGEPCRLWVTWVEPYLFMES